MWFVVRFRVAPYPEDQYMMANARSLAEATAGVVGWYAARGITIDPLGGCVDTQPIGGRMMGRRRIRRRAKPGRTMRAARS